MRLSASTKTFVVGVCLALGPGLGCGDDMVSGTGGSSSSSGTESTGQVTVTVGTTGTTVDPDSTGTSSGTSGTDGVDSTGTTDTGGSIMMGNSAHSLVNVGTVSFDASHSLVWSFGQQTQNQNTMSSPGYTLRGGLVGAIE